MQEIAPGIALILTLIANAYLVGDRASWVLVDACIPGRERLIRRAAGDLAGLAQDFRCLRGKRRLLAQTDASNARSEMFRAAIWQAWKCVPSP